MTDVLEDLRLGSSNLEICHMPGCVEIPTRFYVLGPEDGRFLDARCKNHRFWSNKFMRREIPRLEAVVWSVMYL